MFTFYVSAESEENHQQTTAIEQMFFSQHRQMENFDFILMWTRFHFFLTSFATFTQFQIKIMTFKNIHLLRFGASEFWGWSDANDERWRDRDAQKTFSWWNMMRKYWRRKASVVIFPFSYENFQSIFFFFARKNIWFFCFSPRIETQQ